MNNIETFIPEVWFEEVRRMKVGKKNDDGIWMPYHSKGTFMVTRPFSGRHGVE